MPQLDKVSFLSQFFYFLIFFVFFYILLLKQFLPNLARCLKFREKKRTELALTGDDNPVTLIDASRNKLLQQSFEKAKTLFSRSCFKQQTRLQEHTNQIKTEKLASIHQSYFGKLWLHSFSSTLALFELNNAWRTNKISDLNKQDNFAAYKISSQTNLFLLLYSLYNSKKHNKVSVLQERVNNQTFSDWIFSFALKNNLANFAKPILFKKTNKQQLDKNTGTKMKLEKQTTDRSTSTKIESDKINSSNTKLDSLKSEKNKGNNRNTVKNTGKK